jgi:SAM-dependent methyltransferase/SOS-response transcriptional repressor LexA
MDHITVKHYTGHACERTAAYEAAHVPQWHECLLRYTRPGERLLEIGCGSGRDASFLLGHDRDVVATDASEGMIRAARDLHPQLAQHLVHTPFPFPEAHDLSKQTFDGIYAAAVIMHIPDEELFEFAFQIKSLLRPGGTVLLSFSTNRPCLSDNRDQTGRLFLERSPGEIQLLFERLGFRLLEQRRSDDVMDRGIIWHTLALKATEGTGRGPVDQIETVINRDKKDATYKLALLRALCDIAQTEYRQALWGVDDTVSVPLGLVAEKWLLYYWPIVEADLEHSGEGVAIPQKRGLEINKPIGFRGELRSLISHCHTGRGGLDTFHCDFRQGVLSAETATRADTALNKIAEKIVAGPVKYSGGAINDKRRFFWHDGAITRKRRCGSSLGLLTALGRIHMRGEIWRELVLVGHWISEAIILRWAELTHEISQRRVSVADVVARLLVVPGTGRDQRRVRSLYRGLPDLRCVWTEATIGPRQKFEVDHVIPFSLWHNNDLWNLMPATATANNAKRDRLISRERLLSSRDLIIDYWKTARADIPERFDYELRRSLLGAPCPSHGWELPAFGALTEAVEMLASQRGIQRWPEPNRNDATRQGRAGDGTAAPEQDSVRDAAGPDEPSGKPARSEWRLLTWDEVRGTEFMTALPLMADLAAGRPYDGFVSRTLEADTWVRVPKRYISSTNFVVRVDGDSMERTLFDGDYVVCEWHRTPRESGQVVIMGAFDSGGTGGEFALKRFGESETHWLFHSDNPEHGDAPPLPKTDVPAHPILGIAVYNLTQGCPIR